MLENDSDNVNSYTTVVIDYMCMRITNVLCLNNLMSHNALKKSASTKKKLNLRNLENYILGAYLTFLLN
jgi:hypothetical protein